MRTIKILLGIVGVFVALLVIGGFVWWKRNGGALLETVRLATEAGQHFGRSRTAEECIDETLRRLVPAQSNLGGVIEHSTFLRSCAESAAGLDEVCVRDRDVGLRERLTRQAERCRLAAAKSVFCPQVLQSLDALCRGRTSGGRA